MSEAKLVDLSRHPSNSMLRSVFLFVSALPASLGISSAVVATAETYELEQQLDGVTEDTHMLANFRSPFLLRDASFGEDEKAHICELEKMGMDQEEIDNVRLNYLFHDAYVITEMTKRGPLVIDVADREDEGFWQRYCQLRDSSKASSLHLSML